MALPLLEAAGVDVVISGHSHTYERSCLLDSQYGTSDAIRACNRVNAGSGYGTSGPYVKPPGLTPHAGTVYVVAGLAGSSSEVTTPNHPAMV